MDSASKKRRAAGKGPALEAFPADVRSALGAMAGAEGRADGGARSAKSKQCRKEEEAASAAAAGDRTGGRSDRVAPATVVSGKPPAEQQPMVISEVAFYGGAEDDGQISVLDVELGGIAEAALRCREKEAAQLIQIQAQLAAMSSTIAAAGQLAEIRGNLEAAAKAAIRAREEGKKQLVVAQQSLTTAVMAAAAATCGDREVATEKIWGVQGDLQAIVEADFVAIEEEWKQLSKIEEQLVDVRNAAKKLSEIYKQLWAISKAANRVREGESEKLEDMPTTVYAASLVTKSRFGEEDYYF